MNDVLSAWPANMAARLVLDLVWQSSLIGLLAWLAARTLVPKPAARAWLLLLALGLCFLAPAASLLARAGGIGLLPAATHQADTSPAQAVPTSVEGTPEEVAVLPAASEPPPIVSDSQDHDPATENDASLQGRSTSLIEPSSFQSSPSRTSAPPTHRDVLFWLGLGLLSAWAAASGALALRLARDLLAAGRLCREAPLCEDPMLLSAGAQAARRVGLRHSPRVLVSRRVHCPAVVAWRQAQLLVPHGAASRGFDAWLAVFCHELAHVRRGDCWSRLLFDLATIVLPWQPLIWAMRSEHHRACEEACDDWTLAAGTDAVDFAAVLADWIPRRQATAAALLTSSASQARRRIARLLACSACPQPALGRLAQGGGLALAGMVAALLALAQSAPADASRTPLSENIEADHLALVAPAAAEQTAWRVAAVLGESRWKHWQPVRVLGFDAEGQTVISASRDGTINFWELASGMAEQSLELPYTAITLSADRRSLILGGRDGSITLIDPATGGVLRKLPAGDVVPWSIAASADASRLVVSGGRRIAVIDAASGSPLCSLPAAGSKTVRGARYDGIALSPKGNILAVGEGIRWGTVTLFDVATGEPLHVLTATFDENTQQNLSLSTLCFSPDGQTLLTRAAANVVKLWSVATGEETSRLDLANQGVIFSAGFSPDGQFIATSSTYGVALWDTHGEQVWSTYLGYTTSVESRDSLAFSPGGQTLAIGRGHQVRLFDADTGSELNAEAAADEMVAASLHPDGRRLAAGTSDGQLAIWDLVDGKRLQVWSGHRGRVGAVAYSPDGQTLASLAEDTTLVLWDVATRRARRSLTGTWSRRNDLVFSSDGQLLATQVGSAVNVWEVDSGRLRTRLENDRAEILGALAFGPTGDSLYAVGDENVAVWNLETGELVRRFGDRVPRWAPLVVSPDGRFIATGGLAASVELWDVLEGTSMRLGEKPLEKGLFRDPPLRRKQLEAIAFSPCGQWLVSSSGDGALQFTSARDGSLAQSLRVGPDGGLVREIHISRDGRRLVTVGGDGTVQVLTETDPSSREVSEAPHSESPTTLLGAKARS